MKHLKRLEELFFKIISAFMTYALIAVLVFIIGVIFYKGIGALSWDMLLKIWRGTRT